MYAVNLMHCHAPQPFLPWHYIGLEATAQVAVFDAVRAEFPQELDTLPRKKNEHSQDCWHKIASLPVKTQIPNDWPGDLTNVCGHLGQEKVA